MENYNFNEYGFVEGTQFEGLMPKTMEIVGDEYCEGVTGNEPVLSIYDETANGVEQMKVIDPAKFMEE